MAKHVALVILDGWGNGATDNTNAIHMAHTPVMDALLGKYPNATLRTDGEFVGLPEGQMGNSEVGHMNIGAGRVVYQDLLRIHRAVESGAFAANPVLQAAVKHAVEGSGRLHLMGLLGTGGVHAHQNHLKALVDVAQAAGVREICIHAFTDGRDTDPQSGRPFMADLEVHLEGTAAKVVSVVGRYFAMDRDKRWERVAKAWNLLVKGTGAVANTADEVFAQSYAAGITDEFIEPAVVGDPAQGRIQADDAVVCFNFRTDRCREITMALTQEEFADHGMHTMPLHYVTMTRYDDGFKGVHVAFDKENLTQTLGEVVSAAGLTQLRLAETEKYPHVTFFFSGGREEPFDGESRLMANSPKVATYDLQPEMSIGPLVDQLLPHMREHKPNFICLNFANPDMVGHTGVFEAVVKACEATDAALGRVMETGLELGYRFIVIADHGNADKVVNPDGSPNTAHTTHPVPVVVVDGAVKRVKDGKLADVAPTVLKLLGVAQPGEMTGSALV